MSENATFHSIFKQESKNIISIFNILNNATKANASSAIFKTGNVQGIEKSKRKIMNGICREWVGNDLRIDKVKTSKLPGGFQGNYKLTLYLHCK